MPDESANPEVTSDSRGLGRLTFVSAAEAVGGEASGFTPWLAEHVHELGTELELGLSLGAGEADTLVARNTEVDVGGYSLDIRAETDDGRIAVIENQYGQSDHKHLGQVITYASGLGADVVIWVAESFSDPHLQALRWLNERTDDDCGVFAVQIQFVRIGTSLAAPRFDVHVKPSEWARKQRRSLTSNAHWELPEFLSAIADDSERESFKGLVELLHKTGDSSHWLGRRPGGHMNFHPFNFHEGPFSFRLRDGQLQVIGCWRTWKRTFEHPAYAAVASVLGQKHTEPARGVAFADIEPEELWEAGVACTKALMSELEESSFASS